jgi:signal transduction histidine kinase
MGLGLNFSIGILRLNGGNLQVTSAGEGQGTTVTVMLPRNLNET